MTINVSALAAGSAMFIFAFSMVYAGVSDLTTMKIRNGLVLLVLGAYAIFAPLTGSAPSEVAWSTAVGLGVLLGTFTFFAFGWIGGGDAKLAAATALWFGPEHTPIYLIYTALLGGVFTLAVLKFRHLPLPEVLRNSPWIARLHSPATGIPYGVAMAGAALLVFPQTRWMTAFL